MCAYGIHCRASAKSPRATSVPRACRPQPRTMPCDLGGTRISNAATSTQLSPPEINPSWQCGTLSRTARPLVLRLSDWTPESRFSQNESAVSDPPGRGRDALRAVEHYEANHHGHRLHDLGRRHVVCRAVSTACKLRRHGAGAGTSPVRRSHAAFSHIQAGVSKAVPMDPSPHLGGLGTKSECSTTTARAGETR